MDNYKKGMGNRIKCSRKERKITQEEMAELLGISVKHLSEVERGLSGLSVDNLIKLSAILESSLDYLIKGESNDSRWDALIYNLNAVHVEKQHILLDLIHDGIRLATTDFPYEFR